MTSIKIQRQLEFYFSDSNLVRDKFMNVEMAKNDEGAIPLSVFLTFKRIFTLLEENGNAEASEAEKVTLLKESLVNSSELVCDEEQRVRRKVKFDLTTCAETRDPRTIVIGGFPLDAKLDELIAFFDNEVKAAFSEDESYKGVALIKMQHRMMTKKSSERTFCGFAWIEFHNEDDAVKVFKLFQASASTVMYGQTGDNEGVQLSPFTKEEYLVKLKAGNKSSVFKAVFTVPSGTDYIPVVYAMKRDFGRFNDHVEAIQFCQELSTDTEKHFLVKMSGSSVPKRLVEKYGKASFTMSCGAKDAEKFDVTGSIKVVEAQEVKNTFVDSGRLLKFTLKANKDGEMPVQLPSKFQLKEHFSKVCNVKFMDYPASADTPNVGYARLVEASAQNVITEHLNDLQSMVYEPLVYAPKTSQNIKKTAGVEQEKEVDQIRNAEETCREAEESKVIAGHDRQQNGATVDQVDLSPQQKAEPATFQINLDIVQVCGQEEVQYWETSVYRQGQQQQQQGSLKRFRDSQGGRGGGSKRGRGQRQGR